MPTICAHSPQEEEKKLIVLHGNCQVYQLTRMMRLVPEFRRTWQILHLNYKDRLTVEQLSRCSVYLYQPLLGPKWGDHASVYTLAKLQELNPRATVVSVPSILFKGYWPLHDKNSPISFNDQNFGDSLLDELCQTPYDVDKIIDLYAKIVTISDIDRILQETLAIQEEKERTLSVQSTPWYKDIFRKKQCFNSFIHPNQELMATFTNACLALLDAPPLPERVALNCLDSTACQQIPIAPCVAKRLDLHFYSPDMTYKTYGNRLSYRDYVAAYVKCYREGINLQDYFTAQHHYKRAHGIVDSLAPQYFE